MKRYFILVALNFCSWIVFAQTKFSAVDKSPMDMAYFPADYPILKIKDKTSEGPLARVIYSRPQKNGRVVFGELVEYGMIWRLGANEATEIELYKDAKIGGKRIVKGKYTLYCIPTEQTWTIVINKDTDTWGAFKYDASKDVVRTEVAVQKQTEALEVFSIIFEGNANNATLHIGWDNVKVSLPIEFLPDTPAAKPASKSSTSKKGTTVKKS